MPPPAPQQNERFARPRRIDHLVADHLPRLVVNIAVTAQITGVVEDHRSPLQVSAWRCGEPDSSLWCSIWKLAPNSFQSSPMVRTQCGQMESILPHFALAFSASMFGSATC